MSVEPAPPPPQPRVRERQAHPVLHLPLLLLAIVFSLPFVWLLCSSLQPREQIGKREASWLPERHAITVPTDDGNERLWVTPPETIEEDMLLVELREGVHAGDRRLVPVDRYADGTVVLIEQRADRRLQVPTAASLVERVPAGHVAVREWQLHKFADRAPRWFYLPPAAVETVTAPVWGNYPEAVRAMSSGLSAEQQRAPLIEVLQASRLPWHGPDSQRPITFLTYLGNTLLVAVLGVVGTVLSSALAAYGLARIPFRGRGPLFAITLATMMIPFPVLMVPLYGLFRELGWIGTLMPLWVPAWFGSAFNIFLLRQFFLTLPSELADAARIDGCSELGIWWRIAMPLATPAIAVVALFHFLYAWNDFLGPLLFLNEPEDFTLSLGLQAYQSQSGGSEWHLLMAAAVLLVLPILVLFFLAQKTFIQGIATTGSKG